MRFGSNITNKQGGVDLDKAVAAQEDAKSKRVRIAVNHWRSAYSRVEKSVPSFPPPLGNEEDKDQGTEEQ